MDNAVRIQADEVNLLINAYLSDSGMHHTAFALVKEAALEQSPDYRKHIPRGELIELLGKALMYTEVESHFRKDELSMNCKTGFSLLERHVCSSDPPTSKALPSAGTFDYSFPAASETPATKTNDATVDAKRKGTPPPITERPDTKRAKKDPDAMDVDPPAKSSKPKPEQDATPSAISSTNQTVVQSAIKRREQGPADEITNPQAILLLPGHKSEVFVCAFNPTKYNILATGSKDAVVNLWNLREPPDANSFAPPPGPPIVVEEFAKLDNADLTSLNWNPQGTLLAVGSYDTILRICTVDGGLYFKHTQHQGPIFATRFSKSGRWLVSVSLDGTACLWNVVEKTLHKQYKYHSDCCLDVDWINETMFATCGADHKIYICKIDETQAVATLAGHTNEVNQIKSNATGTKLASCSDDMTTRIWPVGKLIAPADAIPGLGTSNPQVLCLKGHGHSVSTIAWAPHTPGTNEILATASFDGTTRLWDAVTGHVLKVFSDHKRPVYALATSPSGRLLASGSGDGWLHIYNIEDKTKKWSWFAGFDKPGVFEIDWQSHKNGAIERIVLALECRQVAVIDVRRIPALRNI